MGCFAEKTYSKLKASPLQQIWRDHMLAGSLRASGAFDDGFFVFLHPVDNTACYEAVGEYRTCLLNEDTFVPWILERVVAELRVHSSAAWIEGLFDRYLNFEELRNLGV